MAVVVPGICCLSSCIGIWNVWRGEAGSCWKFIAVGMVLYTFPLLLFRKDIYHFLLSSSSALVGGISFIPEVNARWWNGWGHCFFHVMLGIHTYALWASVSSGS